MSTTSHDLPGPPIATSPIRNRLAGGILAGFVIVCGVLINLPYRYVESNSYAVGRYTFPYYSTFVSSAKPVLAGYPFRYQHGYSHPETARVHVTHFSSMALLIDAALVLLLAIGVYILFQLRAATTAHAKRWDFAVAGLILCGPMLIGWATWREHRVHDRLGRAISDIGSGRMSVWLPDRIAEYVPRGVIPYLSRMRSISMRERDSKFLEMIGEIDTIQRVAVIGVPIDKQISQVLQLQPLLRSFRLSGVQIKPTAIETIRQLSNLERLDLSFTNTSAKMLSECGALPRLRSLDLSRTSVRLAELGRPTWAASIEELYVPSPFAGRPDTLIVENWPRLRRLSTTRRNDDPNATPLTLKVSDTPNLEVVNLDRAQLFNLDFENVPRLTEFDVSHGTSSARDESMFPLPGLPWLNKVKLRNLPGLRLLTVFANDLESLEVTDAPTLREVRIGSYFQTVLGVTNTKRITAERAGRIIKAIGDLDGLSRVAMVSLPLAGVDLTPLSNSTSVRSLRLRDCDVGIDQIRQLRSLENLTILEADDCILNGNEVGELVEMFPNLETIVAQAAKLDQLRLRETLPLRRFSFGRIEEAQDIELCGLPKLSGFLHVDRLLGSLRVCDLPELRGIAIGSPWPEAATIDGVADLQMFAAGGPNVKVELLDALKGCNKLNHLTLVDPGLSADELERIATFSNLRVLNLPSADVNDDVAAAWSKLESLWAINLDETDIGAGTLRWLGRIPSLRRVSLSGVSLDADASDALAGLTQVGELILSRSEVDSATLMTLLREGALDTLDITGHPLGDDLMAALSASKSMRRLVLADCGATAEQIEALLKARPLLRIWLSREQVAGFPKPLRERFNDPNSIRVVRSGSTERYTHSGARSEPADAEPQMLTDPSNDESKRDGNEANSSAERSRSLSSQIDGEGRGASKPDERERSVGIRPLPAPSWMSISGVVRNRTKPSINPYFMVPMAFPASQIGNIDIHRFRYPNGDFPEGSALSAGADGRGLRTQNRSQFRPAVSIPPPRL